jgi:hypothetical protein
MERSVKIMLKRMIFTLAFAILLSGAPAIGSASQVVDTVKAKTTRTYNKAKHKVRNAASKTKSTVKSTYTKAKNRVRTDDTRRDTMERK